MVLPVWILAYRYRDQCFALSSTDRPGIRPGRAAFAKIGLAMVIAAMLAILLLFFVGEMGGTPYWFAFA